MKQYFAEPAFHSWIELDTLLRDYELGLVAIAGIDDDTGARPVQWVHSSDLPDPTPFLTPRTVLLTTGVQFKAALGKNTAEAYVSRLVTAGATALCVGVGLRWDRIPPTLVEACEHLGLPLIRVPYDTPFIAITRAASRLIEAAMHAQNIDRLSRVDRTPASTIARAEAALRTAVVTLLILGHRELAESIASPLLPRIPRGQVAVVALSSDDTELNSKLTADALGDGTVAAQYGGKLIVVCEAPQVASVRKLVQRHAAGLSERGSLQDLERLLDQADRALEHSVAASVDSDTPPKLVAYRPSMHSGVFQLIADSPEAKRRALGFLSPIREHDRKHEDELERSLEVWLRHNGQLSPSAAELEIHRHTLRSKIRTAASLLQRDIDSPNTRAELWTALRITDTSTQL
ncbi:MAG: PucR family transcriptional regulator [Leucobacter sp.]